jgi:hypothetical protein
MKLQIRIAFANFWPGFTPDNFKSFFPYVYDKYDLVASTSPEVVFYSVFAPHWRPHGDPTDQNNLPRIRSGNYLRVFMTGENMEPVMEQCEFAMSFSALIAHSNHLRLPLWVYENRGWGYPPARLVKDPDTDWEKVAREKTRFCNFVYLHPVRFRDATFAAFEAYKHVDSGGRHLNNMDGWAVPIAPNRLAGKIEFFRRYKFTLAIENSIWPGYETEKLVDPIYAGSIPIYVGNPLASAVYDPASYIDLTRFASLAQMLEFVREVDNDRNLYLKMLAAPFYRGNTIPDCARDDNILAFFERIFQAALARRVMGARAAPVSRARYRSS